MIRNCFGDVRLTWISGEDAAEIGLVALLHPERFERGVVQNPPGAELLSHAEVRARAERGALAANPLRAHHARGLGGTSCWRLAEAGAAGRSG